MWLLSALGTAICFGVNNTLFKWGTTKALSRGGIQFFFYLVAFVLVLIFSFFHKHFHPSLFAVVIGVLVGILNATGNIQMTKAFQEGPVGITSTIIATNAVIVVVATALFFPEAVPVLHWFGILLMIVSAVVVQYQPGRGPHTGSASWLVHCGLAILSIGAVGFLLKVAAYLHIDFIDLLVFFYAGGLLYLGILVRQELMQLARLKSEIKLAVIIGLFSTTGYSCYLFALNTGPASVVFPVISLSCLVVVVAGLLIFKEKLKLYQVLGMGTAIAGLILTKI